MKVYNVLFESHYESEGGDVHSLINAYDSREKAVKALEDALQDEIQDGAYADEEVEERLVRDGDDFFCFYYDDTKTNWKFRGTVYETEVK